ncbi:MAG: cytochrome c oxidase subunit II [Planctomycetia bacterium]|nr:cytochrome c oxidase subunit II [Planctomycetia bacterium]
MGKFWSFVFFLVPVLGVGLFVVAMNFHSLPLLNHWFPEDVSASGHVIDQLFMTILVLTGVVFVATEVCLAFFLWRYDAKANRDPVRYMHGSHTLEVVWTVLPAATLFFIAIYQMNAWADAKIRQPKDAGVIVEVRGRQFEWRFRYPGPDGKFNTPDDIHWDTDLHVPVDEEVLVHLKSEDVLHSFFLPNMRVKQDAVPGMMIPVWFRPTKIGSWDLVCAELCGWGHYKMRGRITVQSRADFDAWLVEIANKQHATQADATATADAAKPAK